MANDFKIECPRCEWEPDGKAYWRCSCGHVWNTFDTKAKCPACNKQWEDTYCPGCGLTSPHKEWYIDPSLPEKEVEPLRKRKRALEARMRSLGIDKYRIAHLPYLDPGNEDFRDPYEVGCRLLILYNIAYAVHHLEDREKIVDWFKQENLWEKVSEKERAFLVGKKPEQRDLMNLSWGLEGALTLGWTLNLTDTLHEIDRDETNEEMKAFVAAIPAMYGKTQPFLAKLAYRSLEQVYEENLVNELATTYFRDLFIELGEDETAINRMVSYERHKTLNWVRQFGAEGDWDEVDTST